MIGDYKWGLQSKNESKRRSKYSKIKFARDYIATSISAPFFTMTEIKIKKFLYKEVVEL